jgi:hypothetical protein
MNNDKIGESLGIQTAADQSVEILPAVQNESTQADDDFEYARGNLIAVIEKGQEALSGILDVAGMSQHPRSYEVAANIMKTLADAQKDLLELQLRRKKLHGDEGPKTVNNNLFLGSTADLQKLIKKQMDNNE